MPDVVSRPRSALYSSQPILDLRGRHRRDVHPKMFREAVEVAAKRLQITHAHSVLFLGRGSLGFKACGLQGAVRLAAAYLLHAVRAVIGDGESFVRPGLTANKFALSCSVD